MAGTCYKNNISESFSLIIDQQLLKTQEAFDGQKHDGEGQYSTTQKALV